MSKSPARYAAANPAPSAVSPPSSPDCTASRSTPPYEPPPPPTPTPRCAHSTRSTWPPPTPSPPPATPSPRSSPTTSAWPRQPAQPACQSPLPDRQHEPGWVLVWVTVLGPVRAWQADAELDLGAPQQRALLAVLAAHADHPVSVGH